MPVDAALLHSLLVELASQPDGMSTARLCKRLSLRMSVLMRTLAWMDAGTIGGVAGPGWVRVHADGARSLVLLTDAGRRLLDSLPP